MKRTALIMLLALSGQAMAHSESVPMMKSTTNTCSEQFEAQYQIDHQGHTKHVNLWRNNNAVAYQNPATQVTDFWTHSANNRIKLVRLFEQHERGIEYEAKDYKGKLSWQNLYHKLDPSHLAKMAKLTSQGQGCERVDIYQLVDKYQSLTVEWLPAYQLAKRLESKRGQGVVTWSLQALNTNKHQVAQQFTQWDQYYLTDYVDVGDNESDPFLAKMINMGFVQGGASGFYDSKGNQLAGHGHHH